MIVLYSDQKWYALNADDQDTYIENFKLGHSLKDTIVISFQVSDLIREYADLKISCLPDIIDLESFDKQMCHLGGQDRDFTNWNIKQFIEFYKEGDESEYKISDYKDFLICIAKLYANIREKNPEEVKRFETIEKEINKIIYDRQLKGLNFSEVKAKQTCLKLEKQIYNIKNELQLEYGVFMPDNELYQKRYLKQKGYKIIKNLRYTFKLYKEQDKICGLLYEMIRDKQDLDSLLFMLGHWGGKNKTYPSYHGFGSVTSRITIRQPALQNMRKANRSIIQADTGKKLFYIDYSQFEAGILAALSKDQALIQLYNNDIYKDLAENVLKDSSKRAEAKIIFYRYMYGDKTLSKSAQQYFNKFESLIKYVQNIESEILQNKKIGTEQGNFRIYGNHDYDWALSHKIQATASLIFKKALIRVFLEVKDAEFLIPMHDAALYQINDRAYNVNCKKIENIFKEEFKSICPDITPKVNIGDFYK